MQNTFGKNIQLTVFGESHGPAIGCVIDGLTAGLEVSEAEIDKALERRRPNGGTDTARREADAYSILSGVFNGRTTGSPICITIPNEDTKSRDYEYGPARPSHADYTAHVKYNGFEDYRGGGHFSGRITAAIVAAGGILIPALKKLGITIGTQISECAGVKDSELPTDEKELTKTLEALVLKDFPTIDDNAAKAMTDRIADAKEDGDSVGGIVRTAVTGLPAGIGEPLFDSMESMLSHALFAIGGVKGVEFGKGFGCAALRGSEFNDAFRLDGDRVVTSTNNNGGINGGITNGMPITFNVAVRPTPSISKPQQTVNFVTGNEEELSIHGRHDPAIIRRICPVIESITALVIADSLVSEYGRQALLQK